MADAWTSPAGRRVRRQCFERDRAASATCWLCGEPIDYTLGPYTTGGSTEAWEPDHRRPQDLYPELALDPANILPSHARCNRARGKRAALNGLGRRTRRW